MKKLEIDTLIEGPKVFVKRIKNIDEWYKIFSRFLKKLLKLIVVLRHRTDFFMTIEQLVSRCCKLYYCRLYYWNWNLNFSNQLKYWPLTTHKINIMLLWFFSYLVSTQKWLKDYRCFLHPRIVCILATFPIIFFNLKPVLFIDSFHQDIYFKPSNESFIDLLWCSYLSWTASCHSQIVFIKLCSLEAV